ncbi:nucleotide disphospho-sugar-binding domain-containing protein [Amycolatopsis sp. NPDC059021]|uniref:nucleotide disphospho-sugar-binding domain-containing protein n=1 Tax=Amycolatopsis sp. NPDC059021 TaxID=3346704 RepID=UPI003672F557
MRVLFTTWAWPSHLYALVPFALALRDAGHEVLVASQPALLPEIRRAGLPGAVVGEDVDAPGMVRGYLLPSERDGEEEAAPRLGKGPRATRMFLANAEAMTGELVALAKDWRPDFVVFEPTALAGPIAAAAVGVPAVRHLYGTDLVLRAKEVLADALAPLADRHGAGPVDPLGVVTVDPMPAGLQVTAAYRRFPVRFVPFHGVAGRPARLPAGGGRPRVGVTWGHTIAKVAAARFPVREVLSALSGTGVEVVAAVSAGQRELVGRPPGNARVVVDAPLDQVLSGCDAVVAHGGAGSLLTAVRHGLPQLLIPQLPDHAGHAARIVAAGAGDVLTRDEATGPAIRAGVERLLGDGAPREAARRLRDEMRRQPSPAEVGASVMAGLAG